MTETQVLQAFVGVLGLGLVVVCVLALAAWREARRDAYEHQGGRVHVEVDDDD